MGSQASNIQESQPVISGEKWKDPLADSASLRESELTLERILISHVDSTLESHADNQLRLDSVIASRELYEEDLSLRLSDDSATETEPEREPPSVEDESPRELNREVPKFLSRTS